jgi:chemotaxis protein methyltransferase CheR
MVIQEQEFRQFAAYIEAHYGIRFKPEKKTLIEGRLGNLIASMNMGGLAEYMDYVQTDKSGQAAATMLDRITTNYTFFLREPDHFRFFKETVLPYLAKTVRDRDLRIWSAACSTGEEPYTLAMLIDEFFGAEKAQWDTKILATDISQGALAAAKAGVYPDNKIDELPPAWKKVYFKPQGNGQQIVAERIRGEVIFGSINLMDASFPFKRKMHAIFCRNVMIYFASDARDRLVQRLYDVLEPGGFLFIGHSESLNREKTRFRYVMPAVYRKE